MSNGDTSRKEKATGALLKVVDLNVVKLYLIRNVTDKFYV